MVVYVGTQKEADRKKRKSQIFRKTCDWVSIKFWDYITDTREQGESFWVAMFMPSDVIREREGEEGVVERESFEQEIFYIALHQERKERKEER